jgi:hypothetical protein
MIRFQNYIENSEWDDRLIKLFDGARVFCLIAILLAVVTIIIPASYTILTRMP